MNGEEGRSMMKRIFIADDDEQVRQRPAGSGVPRYRHGGSERHRNPPKSGGGLEKAMLSEATDYIIKPFSYEQLRSNFKLYLPLESENN
jgi:hypothetical protein